MEFEKFYYKFSYPFRVEKKAISYKDNPDENNAVSDRCKEDKFIQKRNPFTLKRSGEKCCSSYQKQQQREHDHKIEFVKKRCGQNNCSASSYCHSFLVKENNCHSCPADCRRCNGRGEFP